jgi:hypothetical protein
MTRARAAGVDPAKRMCLHVVVDKYIGCHLLFTIQRPGQVTGVRLQDRGPYLRQPITKGRNKRGGIGEASVTHIVHLGLASTSSWLW